MSVEFVVGKSEPIGEVEDEEKWEVLSKCLMATMPQLVNSVVHGLIVAWSKPENKDEGFEFSVSKTGLLMQALPLSERKRISVNMETLMAPLVEAGYIKYWSKVRKGKSSSKGGSSWLVTYKAVSMEDALEIAKEAFNKHIKMMTNRDAFISAKKWRHNNISVGIISDPRNGVQKRSVKNRLEQIAEGRDKTLVINFVTNPKAKPTIGVYYDAVLVVGETLEAKKVFEARKESSKRKLWSELEKAFDDVDECVDYLDGRLNKKKRRVK